MHYMYKGLGLDILQLYIHNIPFPPKYSLKQWNVYNTGSEPIAKQTNKTMMQFFPDQICIYFLS